MGWFLPALMGAGVGMAAGSLLGGGDVKGQGVQQVSTLNEGQKLLLTDIVNYVRSNLNVGGQVPPSSLAPGGASALQQQAFGQMGQMPGMASQYFKPSYNPGSIQDLINNMMNPVGQYAQNMFQQETIPSIMSALGEGGMARSSGAMDILGREGRNLSMGLASQFAPISAQMQYGARESDLARQFQVPGQMSDLIGQMANMGTLQRGIPEEQRQFGLQQWQAGLPTQNQWLNYLGTALGTPAFTNVGFQGAYQPSMLETLAPAMGMMGAGLFSNPNFLA